MGGEVEVVDAPGGWEVREAEPAGVASLFGGGDLEAVTEKLKKERQGE